MEIVPIEAMGRRIMVMGPSNSGKSTLAHAIGARLDIPVTHIDQLRHLPHSNWEQRPDEEFAQLHDAVVATEAWVMDGGYTKLTPQRFARATGVVVATEGLMRRYRRYFNRTLFQRNRVGGLEGGLDYVNWTMLHWFWHSRHHHEKYQKAAVASGLPHIFVNKQSELNALYTAWDLTRA